MTAIEDARAVEVRTNERGREPWAISLTTEIGPNGYTDTLRMTEEEARELYRALGERLSAPPTDDEREELIEQATWTLIEWDTDTADRGVRDEHYRERRADVERIFPILFRRQAPITEHEAGYDGACRCPVCFGPVTTEFDPVTDRGRWVHVEAARDAS